MSLFVPNPSLSYLDSEPKVNTFQNNVRKTFRNSQRCHFELEFSPWAPLSAFESSINNRQKTRL